MKKIFDKQKNINQRGVAVLFAVLISILLISVTATMISIALRQTILSSTGRDSQYAFYAADTAMDCALYWDNNQPENPSPVEGQTYAVFPFSDESPYSTGANCSGVDITNNGPTNWDQNNSVGITTFELKIKSDLTGRTYCSEVMVEKKLVGTVKTTVMKTNGFNGPTCDRTSTRTVERGLELSYTQ